MILPFRQIKPLVINRITTPDEVANPTPYIVSSTIKENTVVSGDIVLDTPSDGQAGDLLIIYVVSEVSYSAEYFIQPTGWKKRMEFGDGISDAKGIIYYREDNGSEPSTFTVSFDTSTFMQCGAMLRVRGHDGYEPFGRYQDETEEYNVALATTHPITGITSPDAGNLYLCFGAFDGADGEVFGISGTGWSKLLEASSNTPSAGESLVIAQKEGGVGGTVGPNLWDAQDASDPDTDTQTVGTGWSSSSNQTITAVAGGKGGMNYCLEFETTVAAYSSNDHPITGLDIGSIYRISFWIKSDNGSGGATDNLIDFAYNSFVGDPYQHPYELKKYGISGAAPREDLDSWTYVEGVLEANATSGSLRVYNSWVGAVGDKLWLSSVRIEKILTTEDSGTCTITPNVEDGLAGIQLAIRKERYNLGAEKLLNNDFTGGTKSGAYNVDPNDWTVTSEDVNGHATVTANELVITCVNSTINIHQENITEAGKTYRVKFAVTAVTGTPKFLIDDSLGLDEANLIFPFQQLGVGIYEVEYTSVNGDFILNMSEAGSSVTISYFSVKEIL